MFTHSRVIELLDYSKDTGVFIWKVSKGRVKAGSIAGSKKRSGHLDISIDGKRVAAHRLAWFYEYEEFPKQLIDHINGDKCDNRISNLRDVSSLVNQQNERKGRKHSMHGYLGATWCKDKKKWAAQIRVNNKKVRIGLYPTPQEAHNAYLNAKRKLHEGCTI